MTLYQGSSFAYLSKKNSLISRISRFLSQLFILALVGTFYINYFESSNDYDLVRTIENSISLVLLLTIVSTVFIFKEVYKNSHLVPR